MSFLVNKKAYKTGPLLRALSFSIFLCFILMIGLLFEPSTLVFESLESKTIEQKPVFNKIKFIPGWNKDVWMMQQSHHGLQSSNNQSSDNQWDRIAIVVDKNKKTAKFYQLEPGPLQWTGKEQSIDYKISCFFCHSNGPRSIRPNYKSHSVSLGFWQRAKVLTWNLRMKSYGRLKEVSTHSRVPLRVPSREANDVLKAKTCSKCHYEGKSIFARGNLTRQNYATIQFMIEKGFMPPLGTELSQQEQSEVMGFFNQ